MNIPGAVVGAALVTAIIGLAASDPVEECYHKDRPQDYQGTKSTSITGRQCLAWDTIGGPPAHYFGDGKLPRNNFCRDIFYAKQGDDGPTPHAGEPWCYTGPTAADEEVCGVPVCKARDAPATASSTRQQCMGLASTGDPDICSQCPSVSTQTMTSEVATTATSAPSDVRLPGDLVPAHYDVRLQPFMYGDTPSNFSFKGTVKLYVSVKADTAKVTLHVYDDLKVNESTVIVTDSSDKSTIQLVKAEYDHERQFIILNLNSPMKSGNYYSIEMSFSSVLTNDLVGFYYSSYTSHNHTEYLATTQLESTYARRAFPCMDEPALKASFTVTIVRPTEYVSISNMPVQDSSETWTEDGITWVADKYQSSPPMSTYLLAFVVCKFTYKETMTKNNLTYRAWARPESLDEVDLALDVGVKAITFFEDLFSAPFPLPKQAMIAIPDFDAGAMENWGLITYRESAMLFRPGVDSESDKEWVSIVVVHELSHQWFGDLVTMAWWDDLWLNEGFASYMEILGVDFLYPEWKMFDQFVLDNVQTAFGADAVMTSHPLYVIANRPDEIDDIFDNIVYEKGASVIRMMANFLGSETFKLGLKTYISNRSYKNAVHDDLWNAMTQAAKAGGRDIDVKAIMSTWILQMNYPVVAVSRDVNSSDVIHVTQTRYLMDASAVDPMKYTSPYSYRWTIPLTFTSSSSPNFNQNASDIIWMDYTQSQMSIANLPYSSDAWILANVGQTGFYRVNYDQGNWEALARQLRADHMKISTQNRAQIINDAWNLAKSGDLGLITPLDVSEYLYSERDYVPWKAARAELSYVHTMLSMTPLSGAWQNFMVDKVRDSYLHFGLNNTGASHRETYSRALIAGLACKYGIQECLDAASIQFKYWMDHPSDNRIDPNLKATVYCYAIKNGGMKEWQFALQTYKVETSVSEQQKLRDALACSAQPWMLNNYLNLLLSADSPVRDQDALRVINKVASNIIGRPLAWDFFRANYDKIKNSFGDTSYLGRTINYLTKTRNTQFQLDEIQQFDSTKPKQPAYEQRAWQAAKEAMGGNIKWMDRNLPVLGAFLSDRGYM